MNRKATITLGLLGFATCCAATAVCPLSALPHERLWSGEVGDWSRTEQGARYQFGQENLRFGPDGLRARYPKGSYDPAAVRTAGAPLGGAQFRTPIHQLDGAAAGGIGVRYRVLFEDNFEFVKGGKLPGLYGGAANSGGRVPNGTDGFSLRFVWQAQGLGALSAYLPTSGRWGTVFGLGHWRFTPGRSTDLALYVKLNNPGRSDGVIAAWADDVLVVYAPDIVFRTVAELAVDGFFFSTFFGGGTPDWATPVDTASRFGPMELFRVDPSALVHCAARHVSLQARREVR